LPLAEEEKYQTYDSQRKNTTGRNVRPLLIVDTTQKDRKYSVNSTAFHTIIIITGQKKQLIYTS